MSATGKKPFLIAFLITVSAAFTGWWLQQTTDTGPLPDYTRVKVQRGDLAAVVSATGTLNPVNTVQVGSQVSGTIQHLRADFNDSVRKGQVVAQIDPAVFRAKLAEAEANL
ncbi:MAG TPA: biotin/lipoyl-binding protein, partial [Gammaproteobacteria bacterium]|nr:biotin/lipoyl-binding protein [Gammaproteobacteria bacterium]